MNPGTATVLDQPTKFTVPALLNLIKRRGGEAHQTFSETPTFYDETADRALDQQVNAVLTNAGLMGARGMDRDLLSVLDSLSQPQLEYYGWFDGEFEDGSPGNFAAYAGSGSGGGFALIKVNGQEDVVLQRQRSDRLLQTFLDMIPVARPAAGQPLVTSKSEYDSGRAATADEGPGSIMRSAPGRHDTLSPLKEMKRIMALPRTGAGTLYVAGRRGPGTRRQRCPRPINFIDTSEGRWLMEERPGGRGDSLVVFTPGSLQAIGERLRNAQSALT